MKYSGSKWTWLTVRLSTGRYRQVPLDHRRAARLLAGAAALSPYAHARGIIHRDIKPSNLLLAGKSDHLLVTDFGIAKILGTSTLTDAGMTIGTVAYMSPEQLAVGKDLTPATDQYSLGVVAYEMIAGVRPFAADAPGQFAVMQATQPLPSLRAKAPHCPPELAALFTACSRPARKTAGPTFRSSSGRPRKSLLLAGRLPLAPLQAVVGFAA